MGAEGRLKVYLFFKFHLSSLSRQHPVAVLVLLLATLSAAAELGASVYWSSRQNEMEEALRVALETPAVPRRVAVPDPAGTIPVLPEFSTSEFTDKFQALMKEMGLSADEVSYSLETSKAQPYWRYRVGLQVQSGYPAIRKFLAAASSEFPNVVLDAIRCGREKPEAAALKCELSLSAFFRRGDHG